MRNQINSPTSERMRELVGKHPSDRVEVETVIQVGSAADFNVSLSEERQIAFSSRWDARPPWSRPAGPGFH